MASKGKKTKVAATAEEPKFGLTAGFDVDGTSVSDFVEKSIQGSGLGRDEWFKRLNAGLQKFGKQNGVDSLKNANVTNAEGFQSTLDGLYAQGTGGDPDHEAYNRLIYPMMQQVAGSGRAGLGRGTYFFYDTGWQYKSSASWPSYTECRPVSEAEKKKMKPGSYVNTSAGAYKEWTVYEYVDPLTVPFIARNATNAPIGGLYRITNPARPDLSPYYAMVLDGSPAGKDKTVAEISPAVGDHVGVTGTPNATDGDPKLDIEYLGMNDLPKAGDPSRPGLPAQPPTAKQIQEQGRKLDKKAKGPGTKPTASASGGMYQVIHGEQTVLLGGTMLPAAFADTTCVHTGGGYVAQGSESVFVGKTMRPFARVADATSDGYFVTTGEDTVEIA